MIRVLNVISDTNIGGAGRVILNYLRYSDRDRFETWAALPRGSLLKPPLEEAGAQVLEVEGIADRSFHRDDVKVLAALLRVERPDLVHTHGCLSGRIAAKRCGLPAVYSRHSAFPVPAKLKYPPGRWVNKFVNEHYADRIIAVSPATRDNLIEGGISPRKITVVMNGAAPVPRTGQEEQAALKRELSIPEGHTVFGILAGAEDRMKLLGFRSDVPALLNILDVQLNCSYGTEATSMALLEGMSLGLPTIASDYGGNPYVVEDGGTGLLFPSRNAAALAEAMERLMDRPEERKALGARARTVYEERFTGQVFARNTEKIYLDILKGAK